MGAFLNILVENGNHWHQNSQRARQNIAGAHKSHSTECNTFQEVLKSKAILKTGIFAGGGAPCTAVFWFFASQRHLVDFLVESMSCGVVCYYYEVLHRIPWAESHLKRYFLYILHISKFSLLENFSSCYCNAFFKISFHYFNME